MNIPQEMLTTLRIRRVVAETQDPREIDENLVWSQRIPTVPAVDGELTLRYVFRGSIADVVAPNARALTYPIARERIETNVIPKIKQGRSLDEELIQDVQLMEEMAPGVDLGPWLRFEQTLVTQLKLDAANRREAFNIGMLVDSLDYDRLGMKFHGLTWNMPPLFKSTVGVAWTDAANADPIADILTLFQIAQVSTGRRFRRLTMSLTAFNAMTRTASFQNRAKAFVTPMYTSGVIPFPLQQTAMMMPIAAALLGDQNIPVTLELYDHRVFATKSDGTETVFPLLPINKVILTDPRDDGDATVWDQANAPVPEARLAREAPGLIGRFTDGAESFDGRGPLGYVTADGHNPAGYTYWIVQRVFPRKHRILTNAVMTVGDFIDYVPLYDPIGSAF